MSKPVTSTVKAHNLNSYVDKKHCTMRLTRVATREGIGGGGGVPPQFCYPKSKIIHVYKDENKVSSPSPITQLPTECPLMYPFHKLIFVSL